MSDIKVQHVIAWITEPGQINNPLPLASRIAEEVDDANDVFVVRVPKTDSAAFFKHAEKLLQEPT